MKILIPLDGSKFAENVLEPAAKLANRAGAEVHLLEVVRESEVEAPRVVLSQILVCRRFRVSWPRRGEDYAARP